MNTFGHLSTPRTYRRVSAAAIAHYASTDAQAARLAAFGETRFEPRGAPTPLWDDGLLDRLTQPLSRLRD
ncbi:MAG: hypothetical protein H7067_07345 [Burkholderiales bacterium]|nr:hypothetical protein [Opitutaceae bacterium]